MNSRFFGTLGKEYDLFRIACPHHDDLQRAAAEELKQRLVATTAPTIKVLEIGFGTGITSQEILSANEKIFLSGIDNEPGMLPKAIESLSGFSKERFELNVCDARDFLGTIPEGSLDAVVSVWVIHNMETGYRKELVKRIHKALKKGGIFINGDKIADADAVVHQQHLNWQLGQLDVFDRAGRPDLKQEWMRHYHIDEQSDKLLIEDAFRDILLSADFGRYQLVKRWYMEALVVVQK